MGNGIHSREETTVKPTTTLHDEFGHAIRHICFACRRLDVLQQPATVPLGHNFETQDSVFGQIHVGREDSGVGTMHLFTQEVPLQRTLTVLVVLQSDISVGRKGTGEDSNETKRRLQGLVENVTQLVLEILPSDQRVEQFFAMRQHDLDFTTGTATHGLHVKSLPQLVNRVLARPSTCIQ